MSLSRILSMNGIKEPLIVTLKSLDIQKPATLAANNLLKGGIIATPTDTIYGIAALANDIEAIRKVYEIKGTTSFKVGNRPQEAMLKKFRPQEAMLKKFLKFSPPISDICLYHHFRPKLNLQFSELNITPSVRPNLGIFKDF